MAISELVNKYLEEEMMIAHKYHNGYFTWYQSKSIKQSLKESELATLESLKATMPGNVEGFTQKIKATKDDILKYKLEKNEILKGSANIPKEEWIQDLKGEMGVLTGVQEWEIIASKMDQATQKFDVGMLFFQISLVLGAVCVIIYDKPRLQKMFIVLMIMGGIVGMLFSVWGFNLSL